MTFNNQDKQQRAKEFLQERNFLQQHYLANFFVAENPAHHLQVLTYLYTQYVSSDCADSQEHRSQVTETFNQLRHYLEDLQKIEMPEDLDIKHSFTQSVKFSEQRF